MAGGFYFMFTTDNAEMFAGVAPSLCAFRGVMGEAKFRRFRVRQQYPTVFRDRSLHFSPS